MVYGLYAPWPMAYISMVYGYKIYMLYVYAQSTWGGHVYGLCAQSPRPMRPYGMADGHVAHSIMHGPWPVRPTAQMARMA